MVVALAIIMHGKQYFSIEQASNQSDSRFAKKATSLLVILVGISGLSALSGCAENHVSIQIRQLQAPQVNIMNTNMCTVLPDPMALKLLAPVLDVAIASQYLAFPLIQNNLASGTNLDINRADTRAIQGRFADISLTTVGGLALTLAGAPSSFRIPIVSDRIDGANGAIPGFGVAQMSVIPQAQVAALKARLGCDDAANLCTRRSETVIVTIRSTFETTGGQTLSGSDGPWINVAPYTFPLTVCCGCLVTFPATVDAECNPMMAAGMPAATANLDYCLLGQDFASSCSRCRNLLACRPSTCP